MLVLSGCQLNDILTMNKKPVNIEKKDRLTAYVSGMLSVRLPGLPESMREDMIRGAEAMSAIGVSSEEDHKDFIYVSLHTKKIAEDISGQKLSQEIAAKLSDIVFTNRVGRPIDTIFNFYRAVGNGLNEMGIPIKKMAYPLGQSGIRAENPRNTRKWMKIMREIYLMVHHGIRYTDALNNVTAEWDVMEKKDFENWMRFYQEGAHEKYKTAKDDDMQYLQLGGDGAPMIPFSALKGKLETAPSGMPNMNRYQGTKEQDDEDAEAAAEVEAERLEARDKKVISIGGRLRSVLKLLSDGDVQKLLDGKLDISISDFVKQIQDLQRYIFLFPLKNKNSSTVEDVIIQRGNRLTAQGHPRAGELLRKIAQGVPGAPPEAPPEGPPDAAPEGTPPMEDVGAPPPVEELKGLDPVDMDEGFEDESDDAWVRQFKNNLNFNNDNVKDEDSVIDDMAEITVEAQALPIEEPTPELPPEEEAAIEVGEEPDIEVGEEPDMLPDMAPDKAKPGADMNSLENVTVADVVERLERVSNILKNREIPRELAWIDFMLDKIGLASYFPALAEATKSALESNQYMSTRVEDILSRLRGSIEPESPLKLTTTEEEEAVTDDTLKRVRQNLDTVEQKDRARKEQKEKGMPEEESTVPIEELAQPVNVETTPPAPVRAPRPVPARPAPIR